LINFCLKGFGGSASGYNKEAGCMPYCPGSG
jgi:hypothetical protein